MKKVSSVIFAPADNGLLHTQLWCTESLEGLLYCLNHDTSIKARRSAHEFLGLKDILLCVVGTYAHDTTFRAWLLQYLSALPQP
jgi:hypothetical protein